MDEFNSILDIAQNKICQVEDRPTENILFKLKEQEEKQDGKYQKKKKVNNLLASL